MAEKEIKYPKRRNYRRLKSIDPLMTFVPFVMRQRNDATNLFSDEIDVASAEKFIHRRRAEGLPGLGFLHVFVAAYIRTVCQYPALNRFIAGQRVYTRRNVEYVMSIKKELSVSGEETCIKVYFEKTDTLTDVYNKLNAAIDAARSEGDTATDAVAKAAAKLPRFLFNLFIDLAKLLDYFDLIPNSLLNASPFHGSMIITDLGSLGIPPVFHHIYNFGNLPVFIGLGAKQRRYELDRDGNVKEKRFIPYTVVSDERICDGFYYAQCFKTMRHYLRNPELLDIPPEKVAEDIY